MGYAERASEAIQRGRVRAMFNVEAPGDRWQRTCPKCGNKQRSTLFCRGEESFPECRLEGEHLHRICASCEFSWCELPLDHEKISAAEPLRADAERVLAVLLKEMGGKVAFAADSVTPGGAVYAVEKDGKIEVTLVEDLKS